MWLVAVKDNEINGVPFRTVRFATTEAALAVGLYPCNYGEFDAERQSVAGSTVEADAVVYDFEPLSEAEILGRHRLVKDREIAEAFDLEVANGTDSGFTTSLGWAVYDAVGDLANYERALNSLRLTGAGSKTIKVKSAPVFVTATVFELETVVQELTLHGEEMYARKWALQAAVAAASTLEDLDAIRW